MAFLKSSQITGLSAKDVDVRGFTQTDSINLGDRAYTEHEVLLADAYSITGDVTISDNLILAKLSDDGNAITVTGDASATRTISGSGSLEGSTFAQTPNASLDGMTGELGSAVTNNAGVASGVINSAVTGSPNLNLTTGSLGSGVSFPAGHILQVRTKHVEQDSHVTFGSNGTTVALTILGGIHMHDITPLESTSTLVISATIHPYGSGGAVVYGFDIWDTRTNAWLGNKPDSWGSTGLGSANGYGAAGQSVQAVTSAGTTATRTYKVGMTKGGTGVLYEHAAGMFTMSIWEIKA